MPRRPAGRLSARYEFRAAEEIPDRHYFRRRRVTERTHHLSLAEPTSRYHDVTLAFRDALRANAAAARRYGIQGKPPFVADVLSRVA